MRSSALLAVALLAVTASAQHEWEPSVKWKFDAWQHSGGNAHTTGLCEIDNMAETPMRRHMPLSHDEKRLYVPTMDMLAALDTQTGNVLWKFSCKTCHTQVSTVLSEDDNIVYFGAIVGEIRPAIFAIDAHNGTELWQATFESAMAMCIMPAISHDSNIIFANIMGIGGGTIAMNAHSGELLWNYTHLPGRAHMYPALNPEGDIVYVRWKSTKTRMDEIHAIDVNTGRLVWRFDEADSQFVDTYAPVVTHDGSTVLAWTKYESLYGLDERTGEVLWHYNPGFRIWSVDFSPDSKTIYLGDANGGVVHAIDAETHKQKWVFNTWVNFVSLFRYMIGFTYNGSIDLSTDGKVLFAGNSRGYVFAVDTETGKMLWFHDTPWKIRAMVASHKEDNKLVFVRSGPEVYAITEYADHIVEHDDL